MTASKVSRGSQTHAPVSRRTVLKGAAAAGLTASLGGLVEPSRVLGAVARQEGNGSTLIVGLDGSPSDLDPHSQYDYRSTVVVRGIYEGLVGLNGSATDEFEGLVAESWEANDDQSVWTFKIRPGLTFQDGSPCDSAAVKASYERMLAMDRGAVAVFSRFISDPGADDDARRGDDRLRLRHAAAALPDRPLGHLRSADRQRQGRPGARGGRRLRQRLDAAQRRRHRHRRLEARLLRAGAGSHPGAERRLLARLGRESLRARHRARRRRGSDDAPARREPATSTSWTASSSTSSGSTS